MARKQAGQAPLQLSLQWEETKNCLRRWPLWAERGLTEPYGAFGSVRNLLGWRKRLRGYMGQFCCFPAGPLNSSCQKMFQPQQHIIKVSEAAAAASSLILSDFADMKVTLTVQQRNQPCFYRLFLQGLTQWGGWEMKAFTPFHLASVWEEGRAYLLMQELRTFCLVSAADGNADLLNCTQCFCFLKWFAV